MNRLEITDESAHQAFAILGTWSHVFYEHGQEPDGSAWIAHESVPDDIMQAVIDGNAGRAIEIAHIWTDDDVRTYLQVTPDDPYLVEQMVLSEYIFARYPSGTWICSQEDPYPPQSDEERLALFKLGMLFSNASPE